MSKTAPIPDDVHALIIDKQIELKRKHKVTVKISDIISIIVKNNIHKVGRYLGLDRDVPNTDTSSRDMPDTGHIDQNGTKQNVVGGQTNVIEEQTDTGT